MLTNSEASTALQWKCQFLELKIDCLVCAMSLCDKLNIFISHNLCWQNKFSQFVVPYLAPSISALSLLSEHCPVRSLVVISLLLEVHFILHPPHFAILQFCNFAICILVLNIIISLILIHHYHHHHHCHRHHHHHHCEIIWVYWCKA